MDIRPIRTDEDHRAALRDVETLWGAAPRTVEGDRLDVLATLIDAYENETIAIAPADPVDILQYAIAEMGRSQQELAELLGSRSRASEILARKRRLAVEHIAKISTAWRLPADLLVKSYPLAKRGTSKRSRRRQAVTQPSKRRAA